MTTTTITLPYSINCNKTWLITYYTLGTGFLVAPNNNSVFTHRLKLWGTIANEEIDLLSNRTSTEAYNNTSISTFLHKPYKEELIISKGHLSTMLEIGYQNNSVITNNRMILNTVDLTNEVFNRLTLRIDNTSNKPVCSGMWVQF